MANQTFADYQALADTSVQLRNIYLTPNPNPTASWEFIFSNDIVTKGLRKRPIFSCRLITIVGTTWNVYLNDATIVDGVTHNSSDPLGFFEIFSWDTVLANPVPANDRMTLTIEVQSGEARFSDVVVWYQVREVITLPPRRS